MTKTPPPLSPDNAALLQWKLGRPMTPGLKITLTAEALGVILDACRAEAQANVLCRQLDALTAGLKAENARDATAEAMAEAVNAPKH